ncbi:hypothetical protein AtDm6_2882 [Acetobacter tropicalis]|uniref:Uncharacterized protein n=1 Tax=Acetobacter tropicalis TaxID=104102 RepID=A0A094ZFB4_9PROT|nr:hypothetical protein AtDm6_2882 [Acetobacter tropicalis]
MLGSFPLLRLHSPLSLPQLVSYAKIWPSFTFPCLLSR